MAKAFGEEDTYSTPPKPAEGNIPPAKPAAQEGPQQSGFFAHLVKSAISAFRTTGTNLPAQPQQAGAPANAEAEQTKGSAAGQSGTTGSFYPTQDTAPDVVTGEHGSLEDAGESHDEHFTGEHPPVEDDPKKSKKSAKEKRRKRK